MKRLSLTFVALSLIWMSCQKEDQGTEPAPLPVPRSFEDLQVSSQFDWRTQADFSLVVEGLKSLDYAPSQILSITDERGAVVYRYRMAMNQDRRLSFQAPAANRRMTVKFGSIEKEVVFSGNEGQFDFIPAVDNSDLDPSDR